MVELRERARLGRHWVLVVTTSSLLLLALANYADRNGPPETASLADSR